MKIAKFLLVTLGLLLVHDQADAMPVFIANHGFEAPTLADSGAVFSVTGWTSAGDAGTFNPHAAAIASGAPEGDNVAFASHGSPTIAQVLSAVAQADTLYTLSVQVGNRLDAPFGGYQAELWAGGNLLARDDNSVSPLDGQFVIASMQYFLPAAHAGVGQALEIRLRSLGWQTLFDDVTLDAVPSHAVRADVPEPGLLALLSLGVASGAARRRRSSATTSVS